ncbi:MAG TPA: LysM peptidoglycan-binding domain-containing protein [Bacteroidales bacterium]
MKQFFLITGLFFLILTSFSQTEFVKHKVKSKETLYSISRDYGVTVNALLKANPGLDARIKVDQVILIPKIENEKDFVVFHVTSKTNLRKVANLYNVPVGLLEDENPDLEYRLYPGQKVRVPVGKKIFVVEEKVDVNEEIAAEPEPKKEAETSIFREKCDTDNPNTRKTFKVALMVPLYLEQADSLHKELFLKTENDDFMPFRFLGFYEGALMAADSLKKLGMNIKLYVYDVDDNASKTASLLRKPELRDMDLIIGPFLNKSFDQVARFAGNYKIPIVNPLSFRDEIITNYNSVIKVKPKNSYQNQLVADLIKRDFSDARVFLIKQSAYQDAGELQLLQETLESSIPQIYKIPNRKITNLANQISSKRKITHLSSLKLEGVSLNMASIESRLSDSTIFENKLLTINYSEDNLQNFKKNASVIRNSLVIIYGDNKSFVMEVMNRLNEVRDTFNIRLIGLPNWERFTNLDNNQCNDMNLIYLSSSFTDYELPEVEQFNYNFRQQYATEPGEYAFSGFDVTYFFLYALFHFDRRFTDCLEDLEMKLYQSSYQFKRVGDSDNFENSFWNILEYNQFRLEEVPDPSFSN